MSPYGKKGGIGPTRGKKGIYYVGTFPDGLLFKKISFTVNSPEAVAAIYPRPASGYAIAGIYPKEEVPDWVKLTVPVKMAPT